MSAKYSYKVTGRGMFPVDMLRYDEAWPESQHDAEKMQDSCLNPRLSRTITMNSNKRPTVSRWESFCWSVSEEK